VAHVISAYRKAIDAYYADPEGWEFKEEWMDELKKVSHRQFTTGFYFDKPTSESQNYLSSQYVRDYDYTGNILDYDEKTGLATVEQRSKMVVGDEIEIFGPFADFFVQKIEEMYDPDGTPIDSCPHPKQIIKIRTVRPVKPGWIMRRQK
jgi:putative protease